MGTIINRRRAIMGGKGEDPFAKYVKLKTRNSTNTSVSNNILRSSTIEQYVEKMFIDGVEVTPTYSYVFQDTNYHDVYVLFKVDTTLPENAFYLGNFTANFCDIPENYIVFGNQAIRNHGAYGRYDTIIRATTLPTFGKANFSGWTQGHLWVPDSLYENYKTVVGSELGSTYARLHKLSDWTG